MQLYTFPISHFSEKARWGLELSGLPVTVHPLVPGPHVATCKRLGVARTQVPVLVTPEGPVQGSSAILDYVHAQCPELGLSPDDEVAEATERDLEARLDKEFGEALRRILYFRLMPHKQAVVDLWVQDAAWWARPLLSAAWPVLRSNVTAGYKLHDERVARSEAEFAALWDEVEGRLSRSPWLGGQRFGRLDITAAALLAPLVQPAGHPFPWPEAHPAVEGFAATYRGRPLWRWVERTYAEHRS